MGHEDPRSELARIADALERLVAIVAPAERKRARREAPEVGVTDLERQHARNIARRLGLVVREAR
jgi:hypothetical protein